MNRVDFTSCSWWWPEGLSPQPDQYADFACDITLASAPSAGWLALTCGTWYTLWINGTWIGHGPAREVAPWQYFDTIDLHPHLKSGLNRLRIRAYHFGLSNQSHEACLAGLMLKGAVSGPGWTVALEDRMIWRAAVSPGFLPGAPRLGACNFFAEHVDLSRDPQAWLAEDALSLGAPPVAVAAHPLPTRPKLIPSDLPELTGETWKAIPLGTHGSWQLWAFPGEVFGFLSMDLEAGKPGTCEVIHGESLTREGLPDYRFSGGDFREILELPAERRHWETFDKRALRYLALPAEVRVHQITVREHHQPLREVWKNRPEAERLDERDRAIIAAAARGVLLCCDDLLNDCPRRERAQYNDPALYMEAFPLLFGTWAPYKRWLLQFLRGADADGVLRACYPSPTAHRMIIPDFSLLFAFNVRRYFEATGDLETTRACYPAARAGVAAFEKYADEQGLLAHVPNWVFLCNSFELAKSPRSAALNALWAAAWRHLGFLARVLGDPCAPALDEKAAALRGAWRALFYREGRILDADSSPAHQSLRWWNYHLEADRGRFAETPSGSFILRVRWNGSATRLWVASPGPVRVWCNGHLLLQKKPDNPWLQPHPFHPWTCDLPKAFKGGEILLEVGSNSIDWEVLLSTDGGDPGPTLVGEIATHGTGDAATLVALADRPTALRPWSAPRINQITAGYAIDCGLLEPSEALPILRACVRDQYFVPWLKRTTPLICEQTTDEALIAHRAVVCNTPHSLFFFCRALAAHGMRDEARDLCRRLFGTMIDCGSTTLWEEFAPRSSLCHAWGAMCVPHLLR